MKKRIKALRLALFILSLSNAQVYGKNELSESENLSSGFRSGLENFVSECSSKDLSPGRLNTYKELRRESLTDEERFKMGLSSFNGRKRQNIPNDLKIRIINEMHELNEENCEKTYRSIWHSNRLWISSGSITDIEPLAYFTHLESLALNYNNIRDVSILAKFSALEDLSLDNNEISDISALAGLKKLKVLSVESNRLESLKNLSIPNLQKLSVEDNLLTNLDGFSAPALKEIDLKKNGITSTATLYLNQVSFPDLENVDLSMNRIKELDFIEPGWKVVRLAKNSLNTIGDLSGNNKLEVLDLNSNYLQSLDTKKLPPSLKKLNIDGNQISSFSLNENLPLLEGISVSQSRTRLEVGPSESKLHTLHISNNSSFDPTILKLPYFSRLKELVVADNNLTLEQHKNFWSLFSLEKLFTSSLRIEGSDSFYSEAESYQLLSENVFHKLMQDHIDPSGAGESSMIRLNLVVEGYYKP